MDGDEEETQQERAMAKYAVDDGENIALPIRLAILRPTFFFAFESPHLLQVMSGIVKLLMTWHVTVCPSVSCNFGCSGPDLMWA